MMTKETLFMG